jgi:hypothetical protein
MTTYLDKAKSLIDAERKRQKEVEGWTAEHDDEEHQRGELAAAAACYCLLAAGKSDVRPFSDLKGRLIWRRRRWAINRFWPWGWKWWKPKSQREDLVRAGALIVAEIERLDRAAEAILALTSKGNPNG